MTTNAPSNDGKVPDSSAPDLSQDLPQGGDRFSPSLIGRTAWTVHGEHGTIVGPSLCDPARCSFRPNGDPAVVETFTPRVRTLTLDVPVRAEIPDVLYAVSARIDLRHDPAYRCTVAWPTFYLDSRVQGITGEDHALEIVLDMFGRLGHGRDDLHVQIAATHAPITDRTES
jgi:hypothetical protein